MARSDNNRKLENFADKGFLKAFFSKGCYRLSGAATLTNVEAAGVLVAANATFDDTYDDGQNGKWEGPESGEEWTAGFFLAW